MNYFLKTFGCQMNYADSEKINMILLQSGLKKSWTIEDADVVLLNTCSVRKKWEDRVFWYVREAKEASMRTGKNIIVGITGCMVRKTGLHEQFYTTERKRKATKQIERLVDINSLFNSDDKLFGITDDIDFTLRIEEIGYLSKILSIITGQELGNDAKWNDYLQLKQAQDNPASANIIIQTGCDNLCTYCIVPFTRWRERSRPSDAIISEIQEVVSKGAKEVTLLGQNVNSYWKETKKKLWNSEDLKWVTALAKEAFHPTSPLSWPIKRDDQTSLVIGDTTPFRELLAGISGVEWLERIRFTSSNPHDMTLDILSAHFELPRMCNYLHFALQSWSDGVLKRMNRKHTYSDFKSQLEYLRSKDPLFSISTDIIVGFPGETEEEFQETVRAFEECSFDFAYIARYSPRRGTVAGDRLVDDIPMKEKARRWDILNTLLYASVQKRNELMIGRTEVILISARGKEDRLVGRTRNFKEVYIDEDPSIQIWDMVKVSISELDRWVLKGQRI